MVGGIPYLAFLYLLEPKTPKAPSPRKTIVEGSGVGYTPKPPNR